MRYLSAVVVASLLMVACKPSAKPSGSDAGAAASAAPAPKDSLPIDLEQRVVALCQKLVQAGVAKNCTEFRGSSKAGYLFVKFDPMAGAKEEGLVTVFFGSKYDGDGVWPIVDPAKPAGDDYPMMWMTSPPGTTWGQWRIQWGSEKYEACRKASPVAACAKKFPAEYASSKAIYEASKRIAAGG